MDGDSELQVKTPGRGLGGKLPLYRGPTSVSAGHPYRNALQELQKFENFPAKKFEISLWFTNI